MIKKIFKALPVVLFILIFFVVAGVFLQGRSHRVVLVHPVRGLAVQAVYATGTVEPVVMLPVAPRMSSRLKALLVDEGQPVQKGEILARLEDTDIRKELEEAQIRVDFAQKAYDRKAPLVENGAVSHQSFDQAEAELESAKAVVEKITANLSYMTLFAPDEGMVIRRDGEIGEFIAAGQPVFWLGSGGMRVITEVDEEDIALIAPGQKAFISADAFPGQVFEGQVQTITPKGDPVARSYRVRITLSADTELMIGMTAEANIVTRENNNALLIPASAIQNEAVWVVKAGELQSRKVKLDAQNLDTVEVLEGLSESDLIVKNPSEDLKEGLEIKTRLGSWKVRP